MFLIGLPVWYFYRAYWTDLRQDFSDLAYIFLFIILCNYSLCYVLFLHYVIVLFSLSGASYCAGYLFIIIIYSIVKLNVFLLLCISIYSVACVSFFIHCVNLFDL